MNRRDRRNKLSEIASVASALRSDAASQGETPDLTSSILSRVDAQRPFLDRATRRAIWIGRFGLGASVAMVVLSVCLAWRLFPERMDLSHQPSPLSAVVDTVGTHATTQLVSLRQSIDSVGQTDPNKFIAAMALRIEPAQRNREVVGPTMPAFEAVSRGVCVQPMTLSRATLLAPANSQTAFPARSTLVSGANHSEMSGAAIRAASFTVDGPMRPSVILDEQDMDSGFSPK